jgi:hypothetical protein
MSLIHVLFAATNAFLAFVWRIPSLVWKLLAFVWNIPALVWKLLALAWKKIPALARKFFAATDAPDDAQATDAQTNDGENRGEGQGDPLETLISSVTGRCDTLGMVSIYFVLYSMLADNAFFVWQPTRKPTNLASRLSSTTFTKTSR